MANVISFKSYCPDTQIHRHTQTGSIALLGPLKWAAKFGVNWRIAIISATVSWTSVYEKALISVYEKALISHAKAMDSKITSTHLHTLCPSYASFMQ